MQLMKKSRPRRRVLFLSFLLPFSILLLSYFVVQFWPVGDRSPLTIDLYHQYASFISELRRKIMDGESLFYSWSVGLGTNYYALLAYYAASPLNLFLVFFPPEHITEAVTFLIVTKIGLSGMTFAALLSYGMAYDGLFTVRAKEKKADCTSEDIGTDAAIVAVSTAFALNAFNLAFSWDIMWLDVIVLLPLVILGLHQLIRRQKFALYTISLALTLFVNYYIAFFVCLFTALYFFVSFATAKSEQAERRLTSSSTDEVQSAEPQIHFGPTVLRFAFFTLLAVAISAILLLPTGLSLADTSAAGDKFPTTPSFRFSLFDFMTQQLMNIPPSIRDGLPNVYNGILVFVFLPLYMLSKRIAIEEKLPHLTLLAFLFISFNFNFLDFIWHGFHYPNQLPYRYSFLFSFLILLMVFRTLTVIREFSSRVLAGACGFGILFVVLAEELNNSLLQRGHAYLNLLFFTIYLLLLLSIWKPNYFRTAALLLAVVMVGEITINTIITVAKIAEKEVYTSRSDFVGDFDDVRQFTDMVEDLEGGDFYRMEILPAKTTNDGALYGYPGFTLFSSTSREDTARLFRRLAYHGNNINSYKYVASTAVGNSLFGIKYLLLKNGATRDTELRTVAQQEGMTLLENPHAIELGLAADSSFFGWTPSYSSPFLVWNDMLKDMANLPPAFVPIKPEVVSGGNFQPSTGDANSGLRFAPENRSASTLMNLEVYVEKDQYVYFAVDASQTTSVKVKVNRMGGYNSVDSDPFVDPDVADPASTSSDLTLGTETVKLDEQRSIHWIETFDAGYCRAGDVVELIFEQEKDKSSDVTVYAATMDKADYESAMAALKTRELDVTSWEADRITASYTAPEAGLLYLTIPYDESWSAEIDGVKVETESIANKALLAVPTEAGEHSIELVFRPKGFTIGLSLTVGGILLLALLVWDERKWKTSRLARRAQARTARMERREALRLAKISVGADADVTGKTAGSSAAAPEGAPKVRPAKLPLAAPAAEAVATTTADAAVQNADKNSENADKASKNEKSDESL